MRDLWLPTPADTHALGVRLGRAATPGTFFALIGDLGAGKTSLARGIGAGLGVACGVRSPTYVLVQSHAGGRLPLWHADWYRLGDTSELDDLALDELGEGAVVVVEWADRFLEACPADRLEVHLSEQGEGRSAHLHATGPRHRALEDGGAR